MLSFFQTIKLELLKQGKLTLFIIINCIVFLAINISEHIFNFPLINYLSLPVNFFKAVLKFWTIITYMFSHEHIGHLFYNMILLYFNGRIFCNLLLERRFVFVYILSGIFGALFLMVFSFFINQNLEYAFISGASAATIGIISALAIFTPNLSVNLFGVFEIKYKYFAMAIFVLFTLIDFSVNTGGKISHFGGAFFGLLYGYLLKNGNDISIFSFYKPTKKTKLNVVHRNYKMPKESINNKQKEIDEILDKISKSGYENLTKVEKEILFKFSQKK